MVKRKTHFSIDKRVGHHFILVHRLPLRITAQPRSNDQFREAVIHAEECIELEACEQHNDAEEKENGSLGSSHSQTKKIIPRVVLSTFKSRFPLLFSHSSSKGSSMSTSSTTPSSGYRKGIRERIMDCISSQDTNNDAHQMLADEDTDNRESDTSFLRELTRTPLSKVWNQYRHKKWGQDPSLPPLEELESQLIQMVSSYCA